MSGEAATHGDRILGVHRYIDEHAANQGHARRARFRVSARFPPTGPFPSREAVDQALADTAPSPEELAP